MKMLRLLFISGAFLFWGPSISAEECAVRVEHIAEQLDAMYAAEADPVRRIAVAAVLTSLCSEETNSRVYTTRGLKTCDCETPEDPIVEIHPVWVETERRRPRHPDQEPIPEQ